MRVAGAIGQRVVTDGRRWLISGALPRPGGAVELTVDGHRSSHRALARQRLIALLLQEAIETNAAGSRILVLQV
jgi:hypothetical protein